MNTKEKNQAKNKKELIIKELGSYVTGDVNPVAKGLCYDTLLYSDRKASAIKSTSKST
ncbi:hypothetical protein FI146_950001 [Flavobacterium psychrophilum]|nr:hypothetical protein FI146_950001 [Flavobacterium psychrophilum]